MFNGLQRWFKKHAHRPNGTAQTGENSGAEQERPLSANLDDNLRELRAIFALCSDVVIRELKIGTDEPVPAAMVYMEGLVDKTLISEHLLKAVQVNPAFMPRERDNAGSALLQTVADRLLGMTNVSKSDELMQLVDSILAGGAVLLVDGSTRAVTARAPGWESRDVAAPEIEPVVRDLGTVLLKTCAPTPPCCAGALKAPG